MEGQEFGAVVHVEALQLKSQPLLQIFDLGQDVGRPLVPDGAVLGPLAENVGKGEAPDETAGHGGAAVGNRVGLQEARPVNVPIVGSNGNLVFEVLTATGAAQTFGRVAGARLAGATGRWWPD